MTMTGIWGKRLSEARTTGFMPMIRRRTERMKYQFKLNSWLVGKWVGLRGNLVKVDEVMVDLDNPTINPREKSNLYFGLYESSEIGLIRKWLPRGIPLIEFGASIGVVSCISNKLLRTPSAHVVVEANPRIVPTLEKNRDLNKCSFTIRNCALAYGSATVDFFVSKYFVQSSVHDRGNDTTVKITVPAISLGQVLEQTGFKKVSLIVDVEGSEIDLVKKEAQAIREHVVTIVLETHPNIFGDVANSELLKAVRALGFEIIDAIPDWNVTVFRNINLELSPSED